jgi:transposase InsO family protein
MIYPVIQSLSSQHPVRGLCGVLEVSFSGYYAWKRGQTHVLGATKAERAGQVKAVFMEHRRRYGAVRIGKELAARGFKIGRYQIRTLMKGQELVAIQPKSFVPKTTDSKHGLGRSPNLLLDRPASLRPNEIFVGDITYIPLLDGSFLYLATWQDQCSRKIVGWELMDNMQTNLVIKALQKAIDRRVLPKGLIVHSDGGGQYAAHRFRQLLAAHDFLSSMTRKDNLYDNAMAESLFSRFKAELLEKGAFANFEEAYTEIFEYIEIYYNRKRRHSGIDYQIPEQYELQWT